MEADGNVLTIITSEPNPALMNYLSEAYGCIIDMEVGIPEDGCVVGTGPYVATEVVTDDHVPSASQGSRVPSSAIFINVSPTP